MNSNRDKQIFHGIMTAIALWRLSIIRWQIAMYEFAVKK